jgi:hypothetical protein
VRPRAGKWRWRRIGPVLSRWTLRTIRASVEWLTEYTLSGVWRVLQTWGLGLHASCARLFSPDPDSRSKVRRLHRCLRDAARHPDIVVALFLDEFGYQRWPEVAPTWGLEAAVAQRAGSNQQWRTIGTLNALTGQVNYLDGYIVGRQQVMKFYTQLDRASPEVDLIYVIQDNWNIHTHPDSNPRWMPSIASTRSNNARSFWYDLASCTTNSALPLTVSTWGRPVFLIARRWDLTLR